MGSAITLPQEIRDNISILMMAHNVNGLRDYVLKKGIKFDGSGYEESSGTLRSSWCLIPRPKPVHDVMLDHVHAAVRREIDRDLSLPIKTHLTPRQFGVAKLVVNYDNPEIAARLGISCDVVKHHLQAVFEKLDISTREELVIRYLEDWMSGAYPEERCPINVISSEIPAKHLAVLEVINLDDIDISLRTNIVKRTVKKYIRDLKDLLQLSHRSELLAYAVLTDQLKEDNGSPSLPDFELDVPVGWPTFNKHCGAKAES